MEIKKMKIKMRKQHGSQYKKKTKKVIKSENHKICKIFLNKQQKMKIKLKN